MLKIGDKIRWITWWRDSQGQDKELSKEEYNIIQKGNKICVQRIVEADITDIIEYLHEGIDYEIIGGSNDKF